ncbi:MAG: hypothetical protein ACO3PV_07855, partial [Pseudohongiellaceae bacterium]
MNKPLVLLVGGALLGTGLVLGVLQQTPAPAAVGTELPTAEYGQRLIRHTARELGSGHADPS